MKTKRVLYKQIIFWMNWTHPEAFDNIFQKRYWCPHAIYRRFLSVNRRVSFPLMRKRNEPLLQVPRSRKFCAFRNFSRNLHALWTLWMFHDATDWTMLDFHDQYKYRGFLVTVRHSSTSPDNFGLSRFALASKTQLGMEIDGKFLPEFDINARM